MTAQVAAGGTVLIIVLPHLLPLRAAPPPAAAALWLSSLILRAATTSFIVLYGVLFLPQTELFHAWTQWCWHAALPLLDMGLRVDGHHIGDGAVILPLILLTAAACSVSAGVVRAAGAVHRLVRGSQLGAGPASTVIVGGADVVLAAAGLLRPRVIVSAGALAALDDDELAAGIAHERGHIVRGHRGWLALAELCRAVGRPMPGATTAHAELVFHLERDADRFAVRRRHDPLALASVICKAAGGPRPIGPALTALTGSGTNERLRQLLNHSGQSAARGSRAITALATLVVICTVAGAAALPAFAAIGAQQSPGAGHHSHHGLS